MACLDGFTLEQIGSNAIVIITAEKRGDFALQSEISPDDATSRFRL